MRDHQLNLLLSFFDIALRERIKLASTLKEIKAGTVLLEQGQRVTHIPFVLSGNLRVFVRHEDKDLLLYFVKSSESCIMSFAACLSHERSSVCAQTLEDSTLLLVPSELVIELVNTEPSFNLMFHKQYQTRYQDLLGTISELVFTNLDGRLWAFLKKSSDISKDGQIHLSHREIASELGTAREVVSRLLKKFEREGKIQQK
jgi:CRP/FNR family transcriptional regulator